MLQLLAVLTLAAVPARQDTGGTTLDRIVPPAPTPAGFVADVPRLLGDEALAAVNARIRAVQAAGRGDIGVAIVPDIGGYAPYEVGVAIYREWQIGRVAGIGDEQRDLGVLLLIVPKELAPDGQGHCWIATGRGAEGRITDGVAGAICRDAVVPRLRERDYAGAVMAGVDAIDAVLAGSATAPAVAARGEGGKGGGPLPAILVGALGSVVAIVAGFFGIRRRRRLRPRICPACGNRMHRLDEQTDDAALEHGQRVEERVRSVDYDVWACDRCGERRIERYGRWLTSYEECEACDAKTARTARRTITAPTTSSTGTAEATTTCEACGHVVVKMVVLPKVTASSSGSGSGGGGGGGASFGGSGATSGGGGGSSY